MKERGILFSGAMPQAIIEDRKTHTRRTRGLGVINEHPGDWSYEKTLYGEFFGDFVFRKGDAKAGIVLQCPYGLIGDRLWVRETVFKDFYIKDGDRPRIYYRTPDGQFHPQRGDQVTKKVPSIHMPRWASRILLEIKDIRVQRVQDISEYDAVQEGVEPLFDPVTAKSRPEFDLDPMPWVNYLWHGHIGKTITEAQADAWPHQFSSYDTARGSFSSLWEMINAAKCLGWGFNPWVWVVEFKKL